MNITAAVVSEMGKASPYVDSLVLQTRTLEPDPHASGQVLVQIKAAGLCHSALSVIDGSRQGPVPMVLGLEAPGVVVDTGPGVIDSFPAGPSGRLSLFNHTNS